MTADRVAQVDQLIGMLLAALPEYRTLADRVPDGDPTARRALLRGLLNLCPPMDLGSEYWRLQDELLSAEREERGVVHVADLPEIEPGIILWRGDITRLDADAIVNAANRALLGCFAPNHHCIDNAIHSAAGLQLRNECAAIMTAQGHAEPTGDAKLTAAYNLPSAHVLHTVGPIITGDLRDADREALASCYRSCLSVAEEAGLASVAFCSISTGEFHFPREEAARIAVGVVRDWLSTRDAPAKTIFNVFSEADEQIYARELSA